MNFSFRKAKINFFREKSISRFYDSVKKKEATQRFLKRICSSITKIHQI